LKIIFLDIDGVLINEAALRKTVDAYVPDDCCVKRLNDLIRKTDARIVVSSCWRIGRPLPELRKILSGWGIDGPVLDKTPDPLASRAADRGEEIQLWINERKKKKNDVEEFVIIDDNRDMPNLLHVLVQTKFESGLTERNAKKALKILSTQAYSAPPSLP
jgi:hypothetical protein